MASTPRSPGKVTAAQARLSAFSSKADAGGAGGAAADGGGGDELLQQYKLIARQAERDREVLLDRLRQAESSLEELHRTRWTMRDNMQTIDDLRRELSDARLGVYQQKDASAELRAEVEDLRSADAVNKRRIQELLALTGPVSGNDVTYKAATARAADAAAREAARSTATLAAQEREAAQRRRTGLASDAEDLARAPRDVLLKLVRARSVEAAEVKANAREKVTALYEERMKQHNESRRSTAQYVAMINTLTDKLHSTETQLLDATNEYLVLRNNAQVAQRVAVEERESAESLRSALEHEARELREQAKLEIEVARDAVRGEVEATIEAFRQQCVERETELNRMRNEYVAARNKYGGVNKELKTQLKASKASFNSLKGRHRMEINGFGANIQELRREIKVLNSKVEKQKRSRAREARENDEDLHRPVLATRQGASPYAW